MYTHTYFLYKCHSQTHLKLSFRHVGTTMDAHAHTYTHSQRHATTHTLIHSDKDTQACQNTLFINQRPHIHTHTLLLSISQPHTCIALQYTCFSGIVARTHARTHCSITVSEIYTHTLMFCTSVTHTHLKLALF